MGDAAEMIVAAELTLAGVPALKVPDNWPSYDVIAQPVDDAPQRISVKARTFKAGAAYVQYLATDVFDWLAIVILANDGTNMRWIYLVPRSVVDNEAQRNAPETKTANIRYIPINQVERRFGQYRDNFKLNSTPSLASVSL
ncbi:MULTISPECIES: hypothetical protein [unclassified Mesorhizobium]|uniref:hypothetical protein n=1 Tax=unclassified Mesorhizobium TaxID=325217 RepID=UPI001CCFEBB8|nr:MULTISPECIES: hypothetical protein [unclassified Mesorhizobium]MBZ9998521.1 hypothetical protein [Mesorhizobium sp. B264B2A]MCA0005066.1 hypothetical protein [Mesorhizobium sp. B264B1B]MCA0019754.1 hypothetical protein [Mesorhizobium sp. B264B1A]